MKIVLDTNIIVSACLGSFYANRLIYHCLDGDFMPLVSNTLLAEYEDVVNRENIFENSKLNQQERNELLDDILSVSQWVEIYYMWRPNLRDEGDNFLIELAIAGNAKYIVSRNLKDFNQAQLNFNDNFQVVLPDYLLEKFT